MNMLEQLLASAGQAADSSRNPFLPAGEHKVSIRSVGYKDGFKGLSFIVELDVLESTTAAPGLYSVVRRKQSAADPGFDGDAKKWLVAIVTEIVRNSGDPAFTPSVDDLKPENFIKTCSEFNICGYTNRDGKVEAMSDIEGTVLLVNSVAGVSKKGVSLTFHNPRPSTGKVESAE
jgi:hypothetical protein